MVSTQLVDNGSERERYADTKTNTEKMKKKKDEKWRNDKSTMPNENLVFFFNVNHSPQLLLLLLLNLNEVSSDESHLSYVFQIQLLLNDKHRYVNCSILICFILPSCTFLISGAMA